MTRADDFETFAKLWLDLARACKRVEPFAGVSREERLAERRAELDAYWNALEPLPLDVVARAAARLSRSGDAFPSSGTWFQLADSMRRAERDAWNPDQQPDCEECGGTGFLKRVCPDQPCGRDRPHRQPHSFMVRCPCRTARAAAQPASKPPRRRATRRRGPNPPHQPE